MKQHLQTYKLNNGINIPKVAFGTWQIQGEDAYRSTVAALKAGYIHIDTAAAYGNEIEIGKAIKDLGIKREDIFITSKLPAEIKGYEETKKAFHGTIERLGVDYLDLYLIHAPRPWHEMHDPSIDYSKENLESWLAIEELYNEGLIKCIGVSNFSDKDIENLINNSKTIPAVNQIYYFPGCRRYGEEEYAKKYNILIEAYSPFATGRIFKSNDLKEIADKYNVSIANLALKWCLQRGTLPLPKSTHEERIISNLNLDFEINEEDLIKIDQVKI